VADISEAIGAVNPLGGGKRLCHWASCANRNWHIIQAAELKNAQRVCCGEVRGDIAVDAPYGNQFRIWPSGEEEHRDRIVNANICV
jgi:hypothetical protein